jgi:hypothetical protein
MRSLSDFARTAIVQLAESGPIADNLMEMRLSKLAEKVGELECIVVHIDHMISAVSPGERLTLPKASPKPGAA